MSTSKKILSKLDQLESKIDGLIARLNKLSSIDAVPTSTKPNLNYPAVATKAGHVVLTEYDDYCLITGNTFDIRNEFKVLGGKWDGDSKGWKIKFSNIENYGAFRKSLSNKCVTLKIKQGGKPDESNSKTSVNLIELHDCMIDDSSDSE